MLLTGIVIGQVGLAPGSARTWRSQEGSRIRTPHQWRVLCPVHRSAYAESRRPWARRPGTPCGWGSSRLSSRLGRLPQQSCGPRDCEQRRVHRVSLHVGPALLFWRDQTATGARERQRDRHARHGGPACQLSSAVRQMRPPRNATPDLDGHQENDSGYRTRQPGDGGPEQRVFERPDVVPLADHERHVHEDPYRGPIPTRTSQTAVAPRAPMR